MLRLLINLDSSVERYHSISTKLNALNIPFERIPAVDGRKLDEDHIKEITYPYNHFESRVRYTRELTKGEVGCFLSHKKCWETLLASDEQWALIMEDDILISHFATKYMLSTDWVPEGVQICQFSCLKSFQKGLIKPEKLVIDDFLTLVPPLYPSPLGTQCYMISRECAKAALSLSHKLQAPVDDFLFSPWFDLANKFTIWRTSPTLVVPDEDTGSCIGHRNKVSVKKAPFFIRHGLTRFLLNRKVKKYQANGIEFDFKFVK